MFPNKSLTLTLKGERCSLPLSLSFSIFARIRFKNSSQFSIVGVILNDGFNDAPLRLKTLKNIASRGFSSEGNGRIAGLIV